MAQFEVVSNTIWKILFLAVAAWIAYLIYDVLLLLFVAYIIMTAVSPMVKRMESLGLPRWLTILGIYLLFIIGFVFLLGLSLAPLVTQMQSFLLALPEFVRRSLESIHIDRYVDDETLHSYVRDLIQNFSADLSTAPVSIVKFGAGVFSGVIDAITVMVFAFYLTLERERVRRSIVEILPFKNKPALSNLVQQVDTKLGAWLRGQLLLMLIIGGITFVGLIAIGMPFPIPLAIIAGFLELIPILGPIFSLFPALLIAFAFSPILAVAVIVLYLLIQQLENSIVVPRVMKQAVGLDPIVVIFALMVGGRLAGVMGALLAVPIAAILMIIRREWQQLEK